MFVIFCETYIILICLMNMEAQNMFFMRKTYYFVKKKMHRLSKRNINTFESSMKSDNATGICFSRTRNLVPRLRLGLVL